MTTLLRVCFLVAVVWGSTLVLYISACQPAPEEPSPAMNTDDFEQLFQQAAAARTARYEAARSRLVNLGAEAVPLLEEKARAEDDWRSVFTATVLLGWIQTPAVYEECSRYVRGDFEMGGIGQPIGGSPGISARATKLYALGEAAVPRLVEMLLKTKEYADKTELASITEALRLFLDPATIPPLMAVLADTEEDELPRVLAAGVLGQFDDDDVRTLLVDVLTDSDNGDQLRGTAAVMLGTLGEAQAVEPLVEIAVSSGQGQALRLDALAALGELADPRAAEPLQVSVVGETDRVVQLSMINTLGKVSTAAAIPLLNDLCAREEDEDLCEAVEDAIDEIQER